MYTPFSPCPKRSIEIIEELFDETERKRLFLGSVCMVHWKGIQEQEESILAMLKVLRAGYTVDLRLQDGSTIRNSNVNDARVKLVYNTTVTAPRNAIVQWRPYSPDEGIN
jgi:hypothetical protein